MVKWRLLPFLRLGASKSNSTTTTTTSNTTTSGGGEEENFFSLNLPPKRFEESMFGCTDELGSDVCSSKLSELFVWDDNNDEWTCRWPSAELCLSTCGQCPLVTAARQCTSHPNEIDTVRMNNNNNNNNNNNDHYPTSEYIDWSAFFTNITHPDMQEKYPHLRGARIISRETPWVAEFPNYLSEREADEVIRIAQIEGYRDEDEHPKHIRDVNVMNCDSINCMRQPIISELYRRASHLLGIHPNNFESMEFINYGPGQHYSWHADEYSWKEPYREDHVLSGPRILTMFHYLSNVDEGGETAFAGPDSTGQTKRLAVKPKKGKVILWANMKNNWRYSESSAVHSAVPVRKGRKYAGTIWVHVSGFRIPELYAGYDCNPRYQYYLQQQQQQQYQQ